MERRLGRGLDSLIGGGTPPSGGDEKGVLPAKKVPQTGPRNLPITSVRPNPDQPRKVFDSSALEELRDSIQRHGVLQPIYVRPTERGFEIIAGERRWRAARMAGLTSIPATVSTEADERMLELALVENLQRQDLDPLEKAHAFRELQQSLGLTQAQVAERVGMKRATVANHLRLLDLPTEAQEAVVQGLITMGHAKALLALPDAAAIRSALLTTVKQELSVRQLERLVAARDGASPSADPSREKPSKPQKIAPWARELENRMRDHLETRVSIENRAGYKGRIIIRYHDREELERICNKLGPPDQIE